MANKYVSYSQYSQYTQCPRQWFLNYGLGLRENKPSINLTFGTAFHETLQNFLDVMYNKSVKEADEIDLEKDFKERFSKLYKSTVESNKEHYSKPEELQEFYEDAVAILKYFKTHRKKYFSSKGMELVGIEFNIFTPVSQDTKVHIKGAIDIITYDKVSKKYTIWDIKTSTRGWGDKEKKDQTKINQILLYKRYFSELKGISEDDIDVIFLVVRRKIYENSEFTTPRISEFKPANGKKKVKDAVESFTNFINEVYTGEGEVNKDKDYPCNPTKLCGWCPYDKRPDLCDKNK